MSPHHARIGTCLLQMLLLATLMLSLGGCGAESRSGATVTTTPPAAGEDTLQRVLAQKRLRVGVKADSPPFGMQIGKNFVGFDIDIALALAKQLGIEQVDFVPVTSGNRIVKLLNGDVDLVIASMSITRYRERKIDFVEKPYFEDGESLLVTSGSPIRSYLDLVGKKVGCVKGSDSSYYMRQVAPDCTTQVYPDFKAMMDGLASGQVDAVTSDMLILVGLMKAAKNPQDYRIAGTRFTTEPYGIAVRQNQSHWRNALADALQDLWENGRYQVIYDSWFGPGSDYQSTVNFGITPYPH